jgi:hypothetical protein
MGSFHAEVPVRKDSDIRRLDVNLDGVVPDKFPDVGWD